MEALHDRGRAEERLPHRQHATCPSASRSATGSSSNHESSAIGGPVSFAKALEVSCNTFFYQIGYDFWQQFGTDEADVNAKDPLVEEAKNFGFGTRTGIDIPVRRPAGSPTGRGSAAYYESMKDYYCDIADKPQTADTSDFVYKFAREFCIDGYAYRAGDAANFSIGQGDTIVTPLQLARAYAALANGGTLFAPTIAKALVSPERGGAEPVRPAQDRHVDVPRRTSATSTRRSRASPGSARWPGRWAASRSTTSSSARRPAPPRSTASSRPAGSRPTPRTTSW